MYAISYALGYVLGVVVTVSPGALAFWAYRVYRARPRPSRDTTASDLTLPSIAPITWDYVRGEWT